MALQRLLTLMIGATRGSLLTDVLAGSSFMGAEQLTATQLRQQASQSYLDSWALSFGMLTCRGHAGRPVCNQHWKPPAPRH